MKSASVFAHRDNVQDYMAYLLKRRAYWMEAARAYKRGGDAAGMGRAVASAKWCHYEWQGWQREILRGAA